MKHLQYNIDTTKFKRTEGVVTESKVVTNYLKNEVIGRKIVIRQLRELGFKTMNRAGKWYILDLELI